jgi:hypothetical protein
MDEILDSLKSGCTKLFTDLFLERNGDPNGENIALFAAFVSFLIAAWRASNGGGHFDFLTFGLGSGAIMVGAGAAMGAKLKTEAALRHLQNRVEKLERRVKT